MTGTLAILGSGETAPTMIKPHRALFAVAGAGPALLLDTPYGFQENADEISVKAQDYFRASVGRDVDVLGWREAPAEGLGREQALGRLRAARWVFAGPGSPTYALRHWGGTPLPGLLAETVAAGGVVVFASAAALTLGSHAIPVYEIYKAGEPSLWRPGLDLVAELTGLPAVVVPHYDNAEGGHHDTRFCYLGERRLAVMEQALPEESFVLGIDEHTGCLLDLAARTATVVGNGVVTVRRRGRSVTFASGSVVDFDVLAAGASAGASVGAASVGAASAGAASAGAAPGGAPESAARPEATAASLREAARQHEATFAAALAAGDAAGCAAAALALEQTVQDWSADTLTGEEGGYARGLLRSMIARLGELAGHGGDPRDTVAPYVEALLSVRDSARAARDFATSDAVRDRLATAGVQVRDTPDGPEWDLPES